MSGYNNVPDAEQVVGGEKKSDVQVVMQLEIRADGWTATVAGDMKAESALSVRYEL